MESVHSKVALVGIFLVAPFISIPVVAEPPDWANASITIANEVCEVNDEASGTVAVGKSTFVLTSSGEVHYHCNGTLLSEPPAQTVRVTTSGPFPGTSCKVVVTKSGRFIAACSN